MAILKKDYVNDSENQIILDLKKDTDRTSGLKFFLSAYIMGFKGFFKRDKIKILNIERRIQKDK